MPDTIVILGAGFTAARAATSLRKEGYDGRIVMIGEEKHLPYDRITLSKHYLYGEPGLHPVTVHDETFYRDREIELVLGTPATAIDPGRGDLVLASGRRTRYDALLIATGSGANRWHGRGADLDGVHYLRTLDDADALTAAFEKAAGRGGGIAVIGTGWIGCEIAAAARRYGLYTYLVGRSEVPLEHQLGRELGEFYRQLHADHGVELHLGAEIAAVTGAGMVEQVLLADGTDLPADIAVFGIGAHPRTELAKAAGLAIDPDNGGIVTDARFRTSDPRIFAAGDVASVHNTATGGPFRPGHWSAALTQGPAAARAILGSTADYHQVPFFFSDQYDIWMEYTGEHRATDELVIRTLPTARTFLACWLRDSRLTAGMNVNIKGLPDLFRDLIDAGAVMDRAKLADPSIPVDQAVVNPPQAVANAPRAAADPHRAAADPHRAAGAAITPTPARG